MFKNHPKGLIGAALSNMGERFGFYIMMAILLLFLNTKFGYFGGNNGAIIYSVFYALTYILALVGGAIADKTKKYKTTIFTGLVLMALGYVIIGIPTETPVANVAPVMAFTLFGLFIIAFGNGLFKGNLQAVVGQLYDDNPEYEENREAGFQIFYMFINVGAMFAPLTAVALRNWWVRSQGFQFNSDLPELCHEWLGGNMGAEATERFTSLAAQVGGNTADLTAFSNEYLDVFTTGFHYSFAVAIIAMAISIVIFLFNKNKLPDPGVKAVAADGKEIDANQVKMDAAEIKQRIYALLAVFAVVIFFWFSFHQNGVTLTLFANDYTRLINVDLGFTTLEGAELFQSFNPIFVVFLTPIVMAFFAWLRSRNINLSTPRKIAIGMGIASAAFLVMMFGSIGLPDAAERTAMGGLDNAMRVTPFLLIGTYLLLTIAELFISPLGLAFVSKVAPPHMQGLMQGAWLSTTALANLLLFIGTIMYNSISIWTVWLVFAVLCSIAMLMMLGMVKWLERVTEE